MALPEEGTASQSNLIIQNLATEAYLDPDLKPETTQNYPDRGIRIENIVIVSPNGKAVNTLPLHTPFNLVFHYFSEQAMQDLRFACHIANPTGARITGQAFPSIHTHYPATQEGQSFSISFSFQGGLLPGLYFIGGGITSRHETTCIHRVIDFKSLRILEQQSRQSYGLCDLSEGAAKLLTE